MLDVRYYKYFAYERKKKEINIDNLNWLTSVSASTPEIYVLFLDIM